MYISNFELYLMVLVQSYFLECEIAIHQVRMSMWHLAVSPFPFGLSVITGVPFCYPKTQINHHSPTKKFLQLSQAINDDTILNAHCVQSITDLIYTCFFSPVRVTAFSVF